MKKKIRKTRTGFGRKNWLKSRKKMDVLTKGVRTMRDDVKTI